MNLTELLGRGCYIRLAQHRNSVYHAIWLWAPTSLLEAVNGSLVSAVNRTVWIGGEWAVRQDLISGVRRAYVTKFVAAGR